MPDCDDCLLSRATRRKRQAGVGGPRGGQLLAPVYDRLRQLGVDEPTQVDKTIENLTGKPSRARQTSYRQRRKEMLLALLDQYTDEVDRAADEIGAFFDHLRQVGVRGFVAEHLNDADYHSPRAPKAKRQGGA